jgi:hypothetical protein
MQSFIRFNPLLPILVLVLVHCYSYIYIYTFVGYDRSNPAPENTAMSNFSLSVDLSV